MAAAGGEVKVIERLQFAALCSEGGEDAVGLIVDEDHGVGHFERRALADADARGEAGGNGALRGADGACGIGGEVVVLQIERADDAAAGRTAPERALDVDKALRQGAEDALGEVTVHFGVDARRFGQGVALGEVSLREHEVQRARHSGALALARSPIFRLGGELVAGDDAPFFHVDSLRDQNFRPAKGLVHSWGPPFWG